MDLGGGTGHLAQAARERYPQLQSAVFDLPGVAPPCTPEPSPAISSPTHYPPPTFTASGASCMTGPSDKIVKLLDKIHAALPEGGGLLIAEKLLRARLRIGAHMQSLNMLIVTEGRERSASQYEALLRAAGFSKVDSRRTGTPLDVILAIK